jgi:enterochelin esterase-like enzyme
MRRRILVVSLLASLLAVPSAGSRGAQVLDLSFHSKALGGTLHLAVSLPPGYTTSTKRYPVVYFLHGLPAGPSGYLSHIALAEDALVEASRDAIVVTPQAARTNDSDPEYHDWGPGRNWETAVAVEVPRFVDANFRTIASRNGRAIVGVSAGGYGAAVIGIHHLDTFSVVESWGGYFHPTNPDGTRTLSVGSPAANARASAHTYVPRLRSAFRVQPTLLAFYVGASDGRFRDENVQLHRELAAAKVPHVFRVYAGGHSNDVWRAHAPAWLELALDRLAGVQ